MKLPCPPHQSSSRARQLAPRRATSGRCGPRCCRRLPGPPPSVCQAPVPRVPGSGRQLAAPKCPEEQPGCQRRHVLSGWSWVPRAGALARSPKHVPSRRPRGPWPRASCTNFPGRGRGEPRRPGYPGLTCAPVVNFQGHAQDVD